MNNPLPIVPLSDIPKDANILVIPLTGWVPKALFEKVKGLSDGQIRGKIERKTWLPGIHYAKRDGGIYINMEAYEAWVIETTTLPVSGHIKADAVLKSVGNIKDALSANTSPRRPQKLI